MDDLERLLRETGDWDEVCAMVENKSRIRELYPRLRPQHLSIARVPRVLARLDRQIAKWTLRSEGVDVAGGAAPRPCYVPR